VLAQTLSGQHAYAFNAVIYLDLVNIDSSARSQNKNGPKVKLRRECLIRCYGVDFCGVNSSRIKPGALASWCGRRYTHTSKAFNGQETGYFRSAFFTADFNSVMSMGFMRKTSAPSLAADTAMWAVP
jgi:hypothetical protein